MLPNHNDSPAPVANPITGDTRSEQMKARLSELDASHEAEMEQLAATTQELQASQQPKLTPGQKRFYNSEQCETARQALQALVDNPQYDTESEYYSNSERAFVDRHLHFLSMHPGTHLAGYISNLKLMTNTRARR